LGRECLGALGVPTCLLPLAARRQCGREIDPERSLGADEGRVEPTQRVRQDRHRLGVAEAGKRVPAPPRKMHGVERHVRPLVGGVANRQKVGRPVERGEARRTLAMSGKGFSMSGREPGAEDCRRC